VARLAAPSEKSESLCTPSSHPENAKGEPTTSLQKIPDEKKAGEEGGAWGYAGRKKKLEGKMLENPGVVVYFL